MPPLYAYDSVEFLRLFSDVDDDYDDEEFEAEAGFVEPSGKNVFIALFCVKINKFNPGKSILSWNCFTN